MSQESEVEHSPQNAREIHEFFNGKTLLDAALLYRSKNLSVIFTREKSGVYKWSEYTERLPTEDELQAHYSRLLKTHPEDCLQVAIITGRISGNLIVLDIDEDDNDQEFKYLQQWLKRFEQVFGNQRAVEILSKTWIVETGRGHHIYFKVTHPENWIFKNKGSPPYELKANGYVVAPPSIHHKHKKPYQFTTFTPTPVEITMTEYVKLLETIGLTPQPKNERVIKIIPEDENIEVNPRQITDDEKRILKELWQDYYVPKYRNNLLVGLSGLLRKAGVSFEDCLEIVVMLDSMYSDADHRHTRDVVDRTYHKIALKDVAGWSWLQKVLVDDLKVPIEDVLKLRDDTYKILKITDKARIYYQGLQRGFGHSMSDEDIIEFLKSFLDGLIYLKETRNGITPTVISNYQHEIKKLLHRMFFLVTVKEKDHLYWYKNGVYVPCEHIIKSYLQRAWDRSRLQYYKTLTPQLVGSILGMIKRDTYKSLAVDFNKRQYVNFRNGVLDIKTMELIPHSPELYFTKQLAGAYDESKRDLIKEWERIIDGWGLSDEDKCVLQEFAGYVLLPSVSFKKALFIYGETNTGKSTFLDALTAMIIGTDDDATDDSSQSHSSYISSIPIQLLEKKRFLGSLYQSYVNICNELPSDKLRRTEVFKTIVSGDPIEIEFKYKESFTTRLQVKLVFAANQLPETIDQNEAFFDRMLLIIFKNKIKNPNPVIRERIRTDKNMRDAITLWAVDGLKRLLARQMFSYKKSVEEVRTLYEQASDTAAYFIKNYMELDDTIETKDMLSATVLHGVYEQWCESRGLKPVSTKSFGKKIVTIYPEIERLRKRVQGRFVYPFRVSFDIESIDIEVAADNDQELEQELDLDEDDVEQSTSVYAQRSGWRDWRDGLKEYVLFIVKTKGQASKELIFKNVKNAYFIDDRELEHVINELLEQGMLIEVQPNHFDTI